MRLFIIFVLFGCTNSANLNKSHRILDGFPVNIKDAPYYVQLVRRNIGMAGGSIISSLVILTAAHCFDLFQKGEKITIFHSSDKSLKGQPIEMKDYSIHHKYSQNVYDVAVLSLKKPLPLKPGLCAPIKLANPKEINIKPGDLVLVVGMGYQSMDGVPSQKLLGVEVPVVSEEGCKNFVLSRKAQWNPTQLCLGYTSMTGYDACQGDSGGPAVYNNVQVGIVSWGTGCGLGFPGVYVQVSAVYSWIMDEMKKLESPKTIMGL